MARVLVVEDSPTQALEIRIILDEAGFDVAMASDGTAALRAVRESMPDMVLTDLQMPGLDGLDLIDALRYDYPYVPVVLMTAFGSEELASQALREGAASYVPKRRLGRDLVPTIRSVLAVADFRAERQVALGLLKRSETEYVLGNDTSLVLPLVRQLEETLIAVRLCDPGRLLRVGIALSEVLVNAIEHGNLELTRESLGLDLDDTQYLELVAQRRVEAPYSERRVHVTARVTPDEAVYTIRDEGSGFDTSVLPDLADPGHLTRSDSRGLLLIRTFMDEVRFNDIGNEITLKVHGTHEAGALSSTGAPGTVRGA